MEHVVAGVRLDSVGTETVRECTAASDARATRARRIAARARRAYLARLTPWGPEGGDAVLYSFAALFALGTGLLAGLPGYRVWAWIALAPYVAAAIVSGIVGRRRARRAPAGPCEPSPRGGLEQTLGGAREPASEVSHEGRANASRRRRYGSARIWVLLFLLLGAAIVPLAAEVSLRSEGPAISHVQPEVPVISRAGQRLARGEDPYQAVVERGGRVESAIPGQPAFESFFPYLPLMAVFGLPRIGRGQVGVTDTRVLFSIVTLIVVGAALALLRSPRDKKIRALQFLTVLPTAALPLATGGDDMPIVAFLLLAMVLAQRRQPGWSGIVLGIVSAMKFTAWPLAVLALFAARDRRGRRAPIQMALGMLLVAGPVVVPFALMNLRAFFDNVVLFPLGLSGVTSPAASNLPGHLLVLQLPFLHDVLPAAVALVGGALLVRRLVRRPPVMAAEVLMLAGWLMVAAIVFAPATRVGYLLYPVDFFVWSWMLGSGDPAGWQAARLMDPVLAIA
ncbi:MAG: glycosyltransferase 87 family protein [Acidimicrobiales bacterium]